MSLHELHQSWLRNREHESENGGVAGLGNITPGLPEKDNTSADEGVDQNKDGKKPHIKKAPHHHLNASSGICPTLPPKLLKKHWNQCKYDCRICSTEFVAYGSAQNHITHQTASETSRIIQWDVGELGHDRRRVEGTALCRTSSDFKIAPYSPSD